MPFSSESHWHWTLTEKLGHEVVKLQENEVTAEDVLERCRADRPDFLWWTRTGDWLKGDAHRMMAELPCPSIAYHLDLYSPIPRGLEPGRGVVDHAWWRAGLCFTPDGGSDEFWSRHGVRHVYMPPGVVESECYLADPVDDLRADVAFVGSYDYHPEWSYRPQLIDWLRATYGERFRWWGGPNQVRGHRLNEVYASSKVVIGDSLVPGFTHERYWSDRPFETVGRGGFLIMPWIKGLDEMMLAGEHLDYYRFGDFAGLKETIDRYVSLPDSRERIRRAGHDHVRANHTYTNRLKETIEIVRARLL